MFWVQVISFRSVPLIAFCVLSNRCASVETHELLAMPALEPLAWVWSPETAHRAPRSWEVFTTCNKSSSIRCRTSWLCTDDWLFRRHLRPHCNHLRAHGRRCLCAGSADRSACYQENPRLSNLFPIIWGLNNDYSRPSCSACQLRDCMFRSEYIQNESCATGLVKVKSLWLSAVG